MFDLPLNPQKRQILHIDADAFFASVEQVLNPKLKGKSLIVGGPTKTTGIVSAASYEAKKFGIYSGMPMYLAIKKCPHAFVVQGNFDAYTDFSRRMYEIFSKFTPTVEMTSIDEAFLDITGFDMSLKRSGQSIAKAILMNVYKNLGISVSCGLSSNKTVAKVASSRNKPHKLTFVPFGSEAKFLAPFSLSSIPGVGTKTFSLLEKYGFKLIGEVASLSLDKLIETFGVGCIPLWKKCRGIDNSEVIPYESLPKSISKERTFYHPIENVNKILETLGVLGSEVFEKLRSHGMKAKTVFIRVRYKNPNQKKPIFEDFSFQHRLGYFSSADVELNKIAKALFLENLERNRAVRLIGIGVMNLVKNYNLSLFPETQKIDRLFVAVDTVKKLYGNSALDYGV